MKRGTIAVVVLLAACSWSNSLYQARQLTASAERAERERRLGEAQTTWGQVIVKAESSYARSPRGKRGAEALWLAGQAESRANDCDRAVPTLQAAFFASPYAVWRQHLLLALGLCAEASNRPTAMATYAMLLSSHPDSATRRIASLHQGHVLALQGEWARADSALAGDDTFPARLDRATALAHLGRAHDALVNLDPLIQAGDTTVRWIDYVEELARHDPAVADTLLQHLQRFSHDSVLVRGRMQPLATEEQQSAWLIAAARAAAQLHPAATDRWLAELATRPASQAVSDGRYLSAQLHILRSGSVAELNQAISAFGTGTPEGSLGAYQLADVLVYSRWIAARDSSVRRGAPSGDMAMFALGELAGDSLGAPRLSAWFFAEVERDWPQSPYVPKSILARVPLEPDSADALLARARTYTGNPYIAAANGDVAAQVQVSRLEYALGQFIDGWSRAPHAPRMTEARE
ncbi:MAG TPA: hypothetical protein VGM20_09710 [Gemmatimonadales bacterium]